MGLLVGPTVLKFTLPSGVIQSQTVNLVGGYNVVYIRMFRNKASVLTSNDPAAMPTKPPVLAPQMTTAPIPVPVAPTEPVPVVTPAAVTPVINPTPSPASSNMEGLKPDESPSLLNRFQQLFN